MKFKSFAAFLFLIFEISFHLVIGQTTEEDSDCVKFYKFLFGSNNDFTNENCCNVSTVICDDDNKYIKSIK